MENGRQEEVGRQGEVGRQEEKRKRIAVTGAGGMLGRYLMEILRNDPGVEVVAVSLRDKEGVSFRDKEGVSLRDKIELPEDIDTFYHLAGTEEEADAEAVNLGLTQRLLAELEKHPPRNLVMVSSWRVYPSDAGENVGETHNTWTSSEAGRTKARAEMEAEKWAARTGACLTIARPARMFGTGVHGDTLRLFNRILNGRYVQIRDNAARTSVVTALDCARCLSLLPGKPGIFNISDGRPCTWEALAEAMGANTGVRKRLVHLPAKWAATIYRFFRFLPIVKESLSPEALEPMSRTLTLDNSKVKEATGIEFFDTLSVISREEKNYPYDIK